MAAGYYFCMAKYEDAYLSERFGIVFQAWATRVPAFMPNPLLYVTADRSFDWRTVVRREFYGVALILVAPLVLDVVEDYLEHGVLMFDPVWTATTLAGASIFVVLRTLKKRGLYGAR